MWLRAIFPFGTGVMFTGIMLGQDLLEYQLTDGGKIITVIILYLLGMNLTFKEALQFGFIEFFCIGFYALVSTGFKKLVEFVPQIDYPYSHHIYSVFSILLLFILVMRIGASHNAEQRKLVNDYFLCRQMGTSSDVMRYTDLPADKVIEILNELLEAGKIELFITTENRDNLYKWTANITFPEGMTSQEIQI